MEARAFQRFTRSVRPRRCLQCLHKPALWRGEAQRRRSYASKSTEEKWKQAIPIGGYYEALLSQPLPKASAAVSEPPVAAPPASPAPAPKSHREEILAKARIVFGSPLAGPAERKAERQAELQAKSTLVADVWVPPRPEEPDNCCMSGCVNCVWDRYGEEVEEWAAKSWEADAALARQKGVERARAAREAGQEVDGRGGETKEGTGLDSDLFRGVPVGILEFMKQEKRLKEKHLREGTKGG